MLKKIYLQLNGRIGNQLFEYAFARKIQKKFNNEHEIIIDDSKVLDRKWINSIIYYKLPNVKYVHKDIFKKDLLFSKFNAVRLLYKIKTRKLNYNNKYIFEKKFNNNIKKYNAFFCENGYQDSVFKDKDIYIDGYFQSEKYFFDIKDDIVNLYDGNQFEELRKYYCYNDLMSSNSVCISIKVEHNIGSRMYDVCSIKYWKDAINYIVANVKNPVFFICSDNVDYVLNNLIDASKYKFFVQDKNEKVHVSLAAMNCCKHFIIGNTSFGWWAQYLSNYENKVVLAPSKWMNVDIPIDIYQDNWIKIPID